MSRPAPTADRAWELAGVIRAAMTAELIDAEQRPRDTRDYVYASGFHPCVKRMVLDMVAGDKKPPWEPHRLAGFRMGKQRENDVRLWLEAAGRYGDPKFEVFGKDMVARFYHDNDPRQRKLISGKIDGALRFATGEVGVIETKWLAPWTVGKVHTYADLLRSPWTRAAAYQGAEYLWAPPEGFAWDFVWFVLGVHGDLPHIVPATLADVTPFADEFLSKAEEAVAWRDLVADGDASVDQVPLPKDLEVCHGCWALGSMCFPPQVAAEGAHLELNEDRIAAVERWAELKEATKEGKALWEKLKRWYRGREMVVVGDHVFTGKWQGQTVYDIPDEVKAKYRGFNPQYQFKLNHQAVVKRTEGTAQDGDTQEGTTHAQEAGEAARPEGTTGAAHGQGAER